jgi:membrane associated rhomboid family serine protease
VITALLMADRVTEVFQGIPYVTTALLVVNTVIHLYNFLFTVDVGEYAIQARMVIYYYQYYRIVTSAFLHGGFFHLLMNMMSLYQVGAHIEQQFGSGPFFFMTLWSILLCGTVYCLLSWAAAWLTGDFGWLLSSAVGYSGVLFSYAMVYAYHTSAPTQSICGFCDVPSKLYPWVLLVLIQVVLPNISMMGHLAGVIVGFLLVAGALKWLLPSDGCYTSVEGWESLGAVTRASTYVRATGKSLLSPDIYGSTTALNHGNRGVWAMATGSCRCCVDVFGSVYAYIWYVIETACYICSCTSVTKRNFHDCLGGIYGGLCARCGSCCACVPCLGEWCASQGAGSGNGSSGGGSMVYSSSGTTGGGSGVVTHTGAVTGSSGSGRRSGGNVNAQRSKLLEMAQPGMARDQALEHDRSPGASGQRGADTKSSVDSRGTYMSISRQELMDDEDASDNV